MANPKPTGVMPNPVSATPVMRTRFAPSPTGAQHVGNARTYLLTWLLARACGGTIRLRIEDIDSPRVKPWAVAQAVEDLRWLGLDWDADLVQQTTRLDRYREALRRLQAQNQVYPCTCSRSDIEAAASAPHAEHEGPVYPGTCAGRSAADAATLPPPLAWRFRVTQSPSFVDQFVGPVAIDPRQVGGDFVVWKNTGTPAYQLAVVVDDADMGITQVIRGDDLLPSTPRQLLLYAALGCSVPTFLHVPLVVGEDGRRLAKRHGDTRLAALRAAGVSAEQLLGLLAWSFGWQPTLTPLGLRDLLAQFQANLRGCLAAIPREPFVLRAAHLRTIGYAL